MLEQVVTGVDRVAAFDVADETLFGESAEEDFGDGAAEDDGVGGVELGDFGDVGVRVRVVDFVEGEDGGEFFGDQGGNDGGDGEVAPGFEGLFKGESVEGTGDGLGGAAVAGELVLQRFDGGGFCCEERLGTGRGREGRGGAYWWRCAGA